MKRIFTLLFLVLVSIIFVLQVSTLVFAGCNCPGPNCDHCDGGSKVNWDNRDQSACDNFTDWDANSGGCNTGGGQDPNTPPPDCGSCGGCYQNDDGSCSERVCSSNVYKGNCEFWAGCHWDVPAFGGWTPACTSANCQTAIQTRSNSCGGSQSQACTCIINYPTPPITVTPSLPPGVTPTPTGSPLTPTPTPIGNQYYPGWFKTEKGDVHSNQDIIVSIPSLLEHFASYLVTSNNLSSFAAGSDNDARPELASLKNWYWYAPPYGGIAFPENVGFYSYYTHNKPPDNKIVSDGLSNSTINSSARSGKPSKIEIDTTLGAVSLNETVNLSSDKVLILYINGDLNINANVQLVDNSGIIFVVKGNLNIAPNVTQADGFYLVDKTVNSSDSSGSGSSLTIRGGVYVSQNGKIFGNSRQIHDGVTPSEKIIYEPKYLVEFAQGFGHSGITWREVAP